MPPLGFRFDGLLPMFILPYSSSGVAYITQVSWLKKKTKSKDKCSLPIRFSRLVRFNINLTELTKNKFRFGIWFLKSYLIFFFILVRSFC